MDESSSISVLDSPLLGFPSFGAFHHGNWWWWEHWKGLPSLLNRGSLIDWESRRSKHHMWHSTHKPNFIYLFISAPWCQKRSPYNTFSIYIWPLGTVQRSVIVVHTYVARECTPKKKKKSYMPLYNSKAIHKTHLGKVDGSLQREHTHTFMSASSCFHTITQDLRHFWGRRAHKRKIQMWRVPASFLSLQDPLLTCFSNPKIKVSSHLPKSKQYKDVTRSFFFFFFFILS